MNKIYELIDQTDDEIHYTMGLYLTLADAFDAAKDKDSPLEINNDGVEFHIYERKVGETSWGDIGTLKATVNWTFEPNDDDEDDDSQWKCEIKMEGL